MRYYAYTSKVLTGLVVFFLMLGCSTNKSTVPKDNQLTAAEKDAGWQLLFDGENVTGWRGYLMDTLPAGWQGKDGALMSLGKGADVGGDIIYEKPYTNFELKLDWKISTGGNSGIFYHIVEHEKYDSPYQTGPEYQLIDDIGFPEKLEEWQQTGADYAMHVADSTQKVLHPVGEWNSSRIVFDNGHVEHWLNGKKIVEFQAWTDDWNQKTKDGKWYEFPDYGLAKSGYIGLQDHGSEIWFKNIKIREIK